MAGVQTFPGPSWSFREVSPNQYKQIGNAVPVALAIMGRRCVLASLGCIPIDRVGQVAPLQGEVTSRFKPQPYNSYTSNLMLAFLGQFHAKVIRRGMV